MWRYNKAVTGTGTLGDLGSHMIDMARFLFGEFEEITAQLHTIIPERRDPVSGAMAKIEVDDFASFQARMIDGMMGVFQTSRNAFGSGNQHEVSIYGDDGTVHASTLDPERVVWIREEEPGRLARTTMEVPRLQSQAVCRFCRAITGNACRRDPWIYGRVPESRGAGCSR